MMTFLFLKNVFTFSPLSGRIAKIPLLLLHNPWSTVKKLGLSLSKTAIHNFYWIKVNFKNSNACNYRRLKIYLPWALTKSNRIHIYRGKKSNLTNLAMTNFIAHHSFEISSSLFHLSLNRISVVYSSIRNISKWTVVSGFYNDRKGQSECDSIMLSFRVNGFHSWWREDFI